MMHRHLSPGFFPETDTMVNVPGLTGRYLVGFRVTICISVAESSLRIVLSGPDPH